MALHQIPASCACYLGRVGPFTGHPVGRVSLESRVATLDYSVHLKQWTRVQYAPETVDWTRIQYAPETVDTCTVCTSNNGHICSATSHM